MYVLLQSGCLWVDEFGKCSPEVQMFGISSIRVEEIYFITGCFQTLKCNDPSPDEGASQYF